jgi:lipopolysaccharide transport system ATP-binding protein
VTADVVIRAEGIGKAYMLGHAASGREPYTALRDVIARSAKDITRITRDILTGQRTASGASIEEFWALHDVTFDIRRGEVVGIVGRNGAGKSTLLKVLSRITEPTCGRVTLKGRVASLLEVGTGFHPELTGRENIFLNGAILGMTRAEIGRKFDEIVAFAEVERFLDTPVKRYSSGMYVRLAFAVAAHLEPEILIVDEVLAVGDAEFQKKCLGKMQDVAGHGRTVLFVSHNMTAVQNLCGRAVVLKSGSVDFIGSVDDAIECYRASSKRQETVALASRSDRRGNGLLRFVDVGIFSPERGPPVMGADLLISVQCLASRDLRNVNISIHICDADGRVLVRASTWESGIPFSFSAGITAITCQLPQLPLLAGRYSVLLAASFPPTFEHLDYIEDAAHFEVTERDVFGTGRVPALGTFYHPASWREEQHQHHPA